jgi:hypothetical protein
MKGKVALEVLYTKNYFLRVLWSRKIGARMCSAICGRKFARSIQKCSSQTLNMLLHDTVLYIAWYCGASLATVLSSFCTTCFLFLPADERSLQGYSGDSSDLRD